MKIAIIASQLKNKPSGMGIHAFNFLSVLNQKYEELLYRGNNVFVIVPNDVDLKFNNLTFIKLPMGKHTSKIKRAYQLSFGIAKKIENLNVDIVISLDGKNYNINHPNFYPIIHDTCVFDEKSKKYFGIIRTLYWRREFLRSCKIAKKVFVPTYFVKENLLRLGIERNKIVVVGDVYPEIMNIKEYKPNFSKKHFLFIGYVSYRKNVHTILKAYNLDYENILPPLIIAGEIDMNYKEFHQEMEKLRSDPNKFNKVHIKGYVNEFEKLDLIRQAYALVFPSFCEGFGIPVIEAAKLGIPSVVPRNSSMFEILESKCFTINNREDPKELYNVLKDIIQQKSDRDILKGLDRISTKNWTYEHVKSIIQNVQISYIQGVK